MSPVYGVNVTHKGRPFFAHVMALEMNGGWAVGYCTPTGHFKKLTVNGNEHVTKTEQQCIDRLRQIAAFRGWEEIISEKEAKALFAR